MKKVVLVSAVLMSLALVGCTGSSRAQWGAIGTDGKIKCWSGNTVIYEGTSNGKIQSEGQSDGWFFQEKGSGDLIRVSGSCLIRN